MYSLINTLLDIENDVYCCSKKAIKMNIPIQNRRILNSFEYYLICICYYIFRFISILTIVNYNLVPLIIIYLMYNYISLNIIIITCQIMDVMLITYLFTCFNKFMKDMLCWCHINNEEIMNTTNNPTINHEYNDKIKIDNKPLNNNEIKDLITFLDNNNYTNEYKYKLGSLR